jgi:hypothetical protein
VVYPAEAIPKPGGRLLVEMLTWREFDNNSIDAVK